MSKDLNPWHPMTDAVDTKHLGKLGEELEPVTGKCNREWLEDEIADVLANFKLVADGFGLDENRIYMQAEGNPSLCTSNA